MGSPKKLQESTLDVRAKAGAGVAATVEEAPSMSEPAQGTVFDSVFKTMVRKAPQLVVPFVNEAFGRDYPLDSAVVQFSNEHEGPNRSTVSDSVFRIGEKIYHIECQSTDDANMVIRMIEYDFAIALEGALSAGAPYEMDFPESCVLFLRHGPSTPDRLEMKVNLPGGESFMYAAKVVKAQVYSSDEIFEKHLLILLPYYLMRYEGELKNLAGDDPRVTSLVAECSDLRASLEELTLQTGETLLYEQLVELIIRVSDYMLRANEAVRRKVRRAMGGEVLELMRERAERLEREAEERGIEQGREIGIEQGIEQGIERGIERGIEQGKVEVLAELVREGSLSVESAAAKLGVDVERFNELVAKFSQG